MIFKQKSKKLISVIIPTYNSEKTIIKTVKSVINQTYRPLEIILIDDNSSNFPLKKVKELPFWKVKLTYFKNSKQLGPWLSRNVGLEKSKWYFISFIDSDDEWIINNKLELQVSMLDKMWAYYWFCGTDFFIKNINEPKNITFENDADFRKTILWYYPCQTSTWLLRKEIITKNKIFFKKWRSEDYKFLLDIWLVTKIIWMNIKTTQYNKNNEGDYNKGKISSYLNGIFLCFKYRNKYPNFYKSILIRIMRGVSYLLHKWWIQEK